MPPTVTFPRPPSIECHICWLRREYWQPCIYDVHRISNVINNNIFIYLSVLLVSLTFSRRLPWFEFEENTKRTIAHTVPSNRCRLSSKCHCWVALRKIPVPPSSCPPPPLPSPLQNRILNIRYYDNHVLYIISGAPGCQIGFGTSQCIKCCWCCIPVRELHLWKVYWISIKFMCSRLQLCGCECGAFVKKVSLWQHRISSCGWHPNPRQMEWRLMPLFSSLSLFWHRCQIIMRRIMLAEIFFV